MLAVSATDPQHILAVQSGDVIGVLAGLLATVLDAQILQMANDGSTAVDLIAVLFAAVVGVFCGNYPARKASHLNSD